MRTQFIRLEAFSQQHVARILAEADRAPEFCTHVEQPQRPSWMIGSGQTVRDAVAQYMAQPAKVRQADGVVRPRKQRKDHRCLVAGVVSWPDAVQWFRDTMDRQRATELREYIRRTLEWLERRFGNALVGAVVHTDEGYPHLHFFCAGDANALHPGLRAEFVDGQRLKGRKEKQSRYKAAMRKLLDDYHAEVASHFGLERRGNSFPTPRIKSRPLALRILRLERRMQEIDDEEGLAELASIAERADRVPRVRMRF